MKVIPFDLVKALCDSTEIPFREVLSIDIEPLRITFKVINFNGDGKILLVDNGIRISNLTFPLSE